MPYTYYIYHKPTGLKYYGVRYSKKCNPNDLWSFYFTSSKQVKQLLKMHGKDSFIVQIRRTFVCAKKAIEWENKVIRRLKLINRPDWLNESNGSSHKAAKRKTPQHKENIRKALIGKKKSPEHIAACAASRRGLPLSETTKQKMKSVRQNLVWIHDPNTNNSKMVNRNELHLYPNHIMGKRNFNRVTPHSVDTRQKMSQIKKDRQLKWMYNDTLKQTRTVEKTLHHQYLNNGWKFGKRLF